MNPLHLLYTFLYWLNVTLWLVAFTLSAVALYSQREPHEDDPQIERATDALLLALKATVLSVVAYIAAAWLYPHIAHAYLF
jgi:hypothetical protein